MLNDKCEMSVVNDNFTMLAREAIFELKVNKSKFIAHAFPVIDSESAVRKIESVRKDMHDARHHPYAYRLSDENSFRYNDDGEPSGSSGKPILDAIDKHGLRNTLVIVTRYFGGVKLGVGGLKRAYFEAADECLSGAKIKEVFITEDITIKFDFKYIGGVMNLASKAGIKILEDRSTDKSVIVCRVRLGLIESFCKEVTDLTNGSADFV
jgi:uncharacterized YigZ family protein